MKYSFCIRCDEAFEIKLASEQVVLMSQNVKVWHKHTCPRCGTVNLSECTRIKIKTYGIGAEEVRGKGFNILPDQDL